MSDEASNISIISAPFSIGGPNYAAKDGPSAILKAGLKEDLISLGFNVNLISPPKNLLTAAQKLMSIKKIKHPENRIQNIELIIKINEWLCETVKEEVKRGFIPIILGGDHSLAIGNISGISNALNSTNISFEVEEHHNGSKPHKKKKKNKFGVLWIDRHFDAHSPKNTPSWRAHGMPVAALISDLEFDPHPDFLNLQLIGNKEKNTELIPRVKKENFVQIAIGEKSKFNPKTKWYSMEDIDNIGINDVVDEAIDYLLKRVDFIYVAWDIDSLNVSGTGTCSDEQLTIREGLVIARAINKLRKDGKLVGFEMMEVAPKLEKKFLSGQTVSYALELITTSFGENLFNNYNKMIRNININAR